MKYFDAIIIGGGIAGSSVAFELKKRGLDTILLDSSSISNSNSMAAGAFISPKISKPSFYKNYINSAFDYTTKLYSKDFQDEFYQFGLIKYPLNCDDEIKLNSYEEYIKDIEYKRLGSKYFFKDAGIVLAKNIILKLLDGIKIVENYKIDSIYYKNGWRVDDFKSKYLIIANSNFNQYFDLRYIRLKSVGGYRYRVRFENMKDLKHNLHKEVSISGHIDDYNIIGATHIKECSDLKLLSQKDSYKLIQKANEIVDLKNLEIIDSLHGYRSSTFDYFPVVGKVVDHDNTLKRYPYIKKGSKVPSSSYIYHKDLFLHTALSSRGFVTAPYNAKLLADLITKDKEIDDRLTTIRLFKRWARKS